MSVMIIFTDEQYRQLKNKILRDPDLKLNDVHNKPEESQSWKVLAARALLGGVVQVKDAFGKETKPNFERIRYGYDSKGRKKSVLYTIKDETRNMIFYGVSRCDLRYDQFVKETGLKSAKERASQAQAEARQGYNASNAMWTGKQYKSGYGVWEMPVGGAIRPEKIEDLLYWFDNLG